MIKGSCIYEPSHPRSSWLSASLAHLFDLSFLPFELKCPFSIFSPWTFDNRLLDIRLNRKVLVFFFIIFWANCNKTGNVFNPSLAIVFITPLIGKFRNMEPCPLFSLRSAQRALTWHTKLCVPLASTQTFTPPCVQTHTCAHTCMHAYMNTLQVNTQGIMPLYLVLNFSWIPRCALILIFPACWYYLINVSSSFWGRQRLLWHMMPRSVIEKNEQSLIRADQNIFSCSIDAVITSLMTCFWGLAFMATMLGCPAQDWLLSVLHCHNNASCL